MILFEDKDIIVCHKTAGIPVQSANIRTKDLAGILKNYLAMSNSGEKTDIFVVHRLDQPVEGILVFAKNKRAAAGLSRQIANGQMNKIYHAVCLPEEEKLHSCKVGDEICLTDYLIKDGKINRAQVVDGSVKDAKKAELVYRVLAKDEETGKVLVEVDLHTGRFHQIRVQMAHHGLPLCGDRKYGNASGEQLALCAVNLDFAHPMTKKNMHFQTQPEGAEFKRFDLS